jgi:hypothetical protein
MTDGDGRRRRPGHGRSQDLDLAALQSRQWLATEALVTTTTDGQEAELTGAVIATLWERPQRAMSLIHDEAGNPLLEFRAGPGWLRERDYPIRHQVLRQGFPTAAGLAIVDDVFRGATRASGATALREGETALLAPDGSVARITITGGWVSRLMTPAFSTAWDYGFQRTVVAVEVLPAVSRDWTWELYVNRRPPKLAQLLGVAGLPRSVANLGFDEGFLYFSSSAAAGTIHVVWRDGHDEVELVVGQSDPSWVNVGVDDLARTSVRSMRYALVRATDTALLGKALQEIDPDVYAVPLGPLPVMTTLSFYVG